MKFKLAILLLALLIAPLQAQQQKPVAAHPKVDQEKVDEAIKKGCVYLLNAGNGMATFNHGMRNQPAAVQAYGELVMLTLLHSGNYTEDSPELQPLIRHLNEKIMGSTYTAALMAMALQKLNAKKYQMRIVQCAQFLCDNQCENGQWDYGEPVLDPPPTTYDLPKRKKQPEPEAVATSDENPNAPKPGPDAKPESKAGKTVAEKKGPGKTKSEPRIPVRKRKPGPPNGDNSNSQYAALGIRACLDANIDVDPSVLDRARKWWLKSQNGDGGWGYNDKGDTGGGGGNDGGVSNDSYGSMSVGATGAMCIYDYYMGVAFKTDPSVLKGVDWIGKNFDVTKNPKKTSFAYLYYLYGLERAGMLFGTEMFGANEWYPVGANHLLTTQMPGGSWGGTDKFPAFPNCDTCFAILFLRRGTLPLKPPVAVATGDPGPGKGQPVANGGQPVPNGGNRDPGLVANKSVEAVAPGWRLMSCAPAFQKFGPVRGKDPVLQTAEEGVAKQPTLRRLVDVAAGTTVKATVGHLEGDSWTLLVKVDGKEVDKLVICEQSCRLGWVDHVVDLNLFAGKSVLVELVSVSGDAALWASVSLGP
jgi:hypothetical protein